MKQFLNKRVKIHINRNGSDLFFDAKITDITDQHIAFIDKFDKSYIFRIEDLVEVNGE